MGSRCIYTYLHTIYTCDVGDVAPFSAGLLEAIATHEAMNRARMALHM